MERLKVEELRKWYSSKRRKPLVIWGARQVGKSYLLKEIFLKEEFLDYIYIDLKIDSEAADFFSTTADPQKYLSYIEARYQKKVSNDLPLVFDEIQECPMILSSLKYFKSDFPQLPIIATGSMVRLRLNRMQDNDKFLFPVGGINSLYMYPFTFEEYLLNSNRSILERIKDSYDRKVALEDYEHDIAMDSLYTFLSIGGMPEVVDTYLDSESYVDVSEVRNEIYENYLADMSTYNISDETILKTRRIYNSIFSQLNKENKNFKITMVEKGRSNRDYFNAYQWLELARIVHRSRKKTGKVSMPLIEEDEGLFRLYLSDVGLFAHQSGIRTSDFMVKDKRNSLSGIFYENYVANEFVAKGIPLYYWTGKDSNEFEFLVEYQGKISPVDVKKGKGKMNSLKKFREFNPHSTAIKISANKYGYNSEDDILTVPLYAAFMLAKEISEFS